MTTTDSNGLIQYQTTDNVVPLQTTLNAISSSVSTSLNSTVRTFKVANDTERNALATTRVPSATNPLIVFNSASGKGYHEINTGSGWSRWIPANASSQTIDPTNGWSWNRQGGILVTSGSVHTLNIDIKRAADSFTKAANATFDFAVIPSSVPTPTGIAFVGVLVGGGQSNPVYIQNGRVYCYCDTSTTIIKGWDYRAALTWIA